VEIFGLVLAIASLCSVKPDLSQILLYFSGVAGMVFLT